MKVKRLTMRSFRGIDNLTLDFDPNITVLIGNNGVGKSSILNSLSTLFSDLVGRLRTSTGSEIMEGDSRQFGIAESRYEPLTESFEDSLRIPQNHSVIQQRPFSVLFEFADTP